MNLTLIGLTDREAPVFTPEVAGLIACHRHFAGGARHRELVAGLLPPGAQWLDVTVPLDPFLQQLNDGRDRVVFASGDPMFFGIGNTLMRHFPQAHITVHPAMNALQMLAHALHLNPGLFKTVSLTGRSWKAFDAALMLGEPQLAILTDKHKTPSAIAERMVQYGYHHYTMHVGVRLGGAHQQVVTAPVGEMAGRCFDHPNCLLLTTTGHHPVRRGIPEGEFHLLSGRPKMITKMPVRLTTLALMQLHERTVMWDVGSCTGSMAIEARLMAPHLRVTAFEKRPESFDIITANCRQFGAPGIDLMTGDFCEADKSALPAPDAIFLGGYGGDMARVLDLCHTHLLPGGVLAFNAVSAQSRLTFVQWCRHHHYPPVHETLLQVDDHNAIWVLVVQKALCPDG
ncbi:precorrin-6Y C5,15-methyltransferase (decarboxylating) [Breznakibacter xylanolyticus]|uniref:Precorrin-6Y C5,15-methyltransferase (Decarboxylating) n=1 Tax=Breznakibacter xylanolyticus TaxID=990 RepID=A0A2W7P4V8_9BACT|nr:precorrin-6y C5,15-methyltransferase (decarboxylating) subunit CbiE [Breznakibacter xylanolyticus]PZX20386.1 precorrin-6Y C5,15-methyltransferase (decarboxylating) [Breznakibacter xylanolyticus]